MTSFPSEYTERGGAGACILSFEGILDHINLDAGNELEGSSRQAAFIPEILSSPPEDGRVIESFLDTEHDLAQSACAPNIINGAQNKPYNVGSPQHIDTVADGMNPTVIELFRETLGPIHSSWHTGRRPINIKLDIPDTSKTKGYALIVRREENHEIGSDPLLHSIIVQSPLIKKLLGKVFDGYKGISTTLHDSTFTRPFHAFFYRWKALQDCIRDESDPSTRQHIRILEDVIRKELQQHLNRSDDLLKNGLITFDYLWTLFAPGSEIYSVVDKQDRLFVVECSHTHDEVYTVDAEYVDTDGYRLMSAFARLEIPIFEGLKPIADLDVLPSSQHEDIEPLRHRLEERGREFVRLQGSHYRSYAGFCAETRMHDKPVKYHIDAGRIMVDAEAYDRYNNQHAPSVHKRLPPRYDKARPPDHHLALCTPMVRGYCLSLKRWVTFYIHNIRKIEWNLDAFPRLVLPHDYKEVIFAFVQIQLSHRDRFDDVIRGKGQGFIVLLSGTPGVGKTLTAESVSEEMKRPLYTICAGDLGSSASEVEKSLRNILEICNRWNAILLLDECDVFLEKRTVSDIERNQLVTIFLRLLEYHRGVMLLTTNRAATVDEAFQSRIHLSINYPSLNFVSRRKIWQTFIRPSQSGQKTEHNISEKQLNHVASMDFNGREIKNIVKTAQLLAIRKGAMLDFGHVQTVLNMKNNTEAEPGPQNDVRMPFIIQWLHLVWLWRFFYLLRSH